MAKGRARGESDLGKPTLELPPQTNGYAFSALPPTDESLLESSASHPYLSTLEALSTFLIPLPFLLAALNNPVALARHHVHTSRLEIAEEALEEVARSAVPVPDSLLSLVETCVLTAGTLLLVGLWGRFRQPKTAPARKRKVTLTSATQPGVAPETPTTGGYLKSVLKRIASVALPFLATVEIGGARTGVLLLTAAASGLLGSELGSGEHGMVSRFKATFKSHRGFCILFAMLFCHDIYWQRDGTEYSATTRGYVALAKSILLLPPPIPTSFSNLTSFGPSRSGYSTPGTPATPTAPRSPVTRTVRRAAMSPMISSREDTNLTLVSGFSMGVLAVLLSSLGSPLKVLTFSNILLFAASLGSAFCLYIFSKPSSLQTPRKLGLALGLALCKFSGYLFELETGPAAFVTFLISVFAYFAALYDDKTSLAALSGLGKDHHDHGHHSHTHSHEGSRFTRFLLARTENSPLIHDILAEKESRRIVYFMMINLGFMFVQTFYSIVSGSLGLLSDSIHMFFDCMGLLAGLIASIMSRWPPNDKFPYGYGKVETLSGLGNGIFLMIISVEIIWESIERFMEGAQLKRLTELMVISVGGLLVNLIGLLFIGHAHHHGHDHGHDHGHGHSHDHANENMVGIYLHILADTMGSVAVIISTILTAYSGWSGWDPIASGIIATLIIAASYPLVVGSARRLLLTVPSETEYRLRNTLQELSNLRGVSGYAVPRFWLDDGDSSGHSHSHDHHDHDHHNHDHSHGHANGHAHAHSRSHSPNHSHSHSHAHSHNHAHAHEHDHHDSHSHSHSHNHDHSHSHDQHGHSHSHDHHDHHDHSHAHDEEHAQRILGVIHIIASRGADVEDVRARASAFFSARNMAIVIQVDREGAGRCWCNGDKSWTSHNRSSSIVPGLG